MPFFGSPLRNGIPIGLGSIIGFGIAPFDPSQLFAAGEQGAWYDPSDFTTMFQDAAGTTPVTAIDQPVGLILDKSGRNNHASQATAISRPLLKQDASGLYHLLFDGSNDSLATAAINFSSTDKMTLFAGVRKLNDAAAAVVAELSANSNSNNGTFLFTAPNTNATSTYAFASKGTIIRPATASGFAAPITNVVTCIGDISGDVVTLRVNGTQVATLTADQGTGNYGNYVFNIGRRGGTTLPFNGRLYSLIVRGAASSSDQISSTETWVNEKTGAY